MLEHSVPILFTRYAARESSGGDGEFRGGLGVEIDLHLRDGTAYLTLVSDRGRTGPHGLEGGQEGAPAVSTFQVGERRFQPEFISKLDRLYIRPGDGVSLRTPGGGGFGDPARRSEAARESDRADGYVSATPRDP